VNIKFVDLKEQYLSIKDEIDSAIHAVIDEMAFIRGSYIRAFEQEFADLHGAQHAIAVSNGTDAIYCSLKMLGIGPGDEVIVTSSSWIASSEVITECGATVVFADIEEDYFTIDPQDVQKKITDKTKAIIAVHLYGQPANLPELKAICDEHHLYLIEDCAQAHLASMDNKLVGNWGKCGTFSFYPGKNLGSFGDAGGVITNDSKFAEQIKIYSNHGAKVKPDHVMEGRNSRMDGLQAAILSAKIPYLNEWTNSRITNAAIYNEQLENISGIQTPKVRNGAKHVYHLYVIKAAKRDDLRTFLKENDIPTGMHYPVALPFLEAYRHLGHQPSDFPNTSNVQDKIISLPMYPELPEKHIDYICKKIKEFYD
jgi:dTDP-4-amino-4,6-dideoxygalactose transaminase